jgi:TRAP-type mannitol/chloroaromatic compound transport system permease small subunit
MLKLVPRLIDRVSLLTGKFSSLVLIALIITVSIVVFLRYTFSIGFIWMQELYIWFHATAFLLGTSYTLLDDEHVRIDIFYRNFSTRTKALINCLGILTLALPIFYLIFFKSLPLIVRSWSVLEGSVEAGGLPGVFLFKSLIALFAILMSLQLVSVFLKNATLVLSRGKVVER